MKDWPLSTVSVPKGAVREAGVWWVTTGKGLKRRRRCVFKGYCENCGAAIWRPPLSRNQRFCGHKCRALAMNSGRHSPNWKGGRKVSVRGYVLVYLPGHQMADSNGYVKEHRLIASCVFGRNLSPKEAVHHVNGDRADNRPENLQVMSIGEHISFHQTGRAVSKDTRRKLSYYRKKHPLAKDKTTGRFIGGTQ